MYIMCGYTCTMSYRFVKSSLIVLLTVIRYFQNYITRYRCGVPRSGAGQGFKSNCTATYNIRTIPRRSPCR